MGLRFEYDYTVTTKLATWAEELPDDIDFIDYWFNLFKSETKIGLDEPDVGNMAAFWVNVWKNNFEHYVDNYTSKKGEGFGEWEREYFATYSQYLVYELQTPSRVIAEHYGKPMFEWLMKHYNRFHCFGSNQFMADFVKEWGLPPGVDGVFRVVNC